MLHLHQYRLVCAIGVCFTRGAECTRCHGRDTLPGVRLNCRGSVPEALAYGAALALWQRRLVEQADAVIVPSRFARERLRELGAPLDWERVHVLAPPVREPIATRERWACARCGRRREPRSCRGERRVATHSSSRGWRPEKGVDVAIDACRMRGRAAGRGRRRAREREARARTARAAARRRCASSATSTTRELAELRAGAAIALAPSRSAETFGLAVAEAMAAGAAGGRPAAWGRSPSSLEDDALVTAGDAGALAAAIARLAGDREAG